MMMNTLSPVPDAGDHEEQAQAGAPTPGLAGGRAPGEFVRDWMETPWRDVQWFVDSFGGGPGGGVLEGILAGTLPVTFDIALDLEATTGTSAEVWLKREHEHQLEKLRAATPAGCGHEETGLDHRDGRQQLCWGYSAEAVATADELHLAAGDYHDGPFMLAEDAPAPGWLKHDLAGVKLYGLEAGWPQFARTNAPVDWVARLKASPGHQARWVPVYDRRAQDTGQVMEKIQQLAAAHGSALGLDVFLYTLEDGAVGVHPCALWLEPAQPGIQDQIEELLNQLRPPGDRGRDWYRHEGVWEL